eukprot:CCRYP_005891-RA/>CCRYP_005891-RA protein AED:0.32 eAED:0.32 QI:31/1/1/1/1/1/2/225/668
MSFTVNDKTSEMSLDESRLSVEECKDDDAAKGDHTNEGDEEMGGCHGVGDTQPEDCSGGEAKEDRVISKDIQDENSNSFRNTAPFASSQDDSGTLHVKDEGRNDNDPDEVDKPFSNDSWNRGQSSKAVESTMDITKQLNSKQYEFIKTCSRVKVLISTALRAVADGFAMNAASGMKRECRDEQDEEESNKKSRGYRLVHAEDLARGKTKECITLRRKIQDLESQIQVLQQENYASLQTATQLQSKVDRTLAALQIASKSNAHARAEADAAQAKADSLYRQVNDFHSLVEELRRGMEAVRSEHDDVASAARSVERRLIQVESELARATKVKVQAEEERDGLMARAEEAERKARALTDKVEDNEHEIRCLKKDIAEMEGLDKNRTNRTIRIENEVDAARGMLLEATSAAAEAESTVTSLNNVIEELRRENEMLHTKMNDSRDSLCKERTKQNEALIATEKEVQKWKLKCEEEQELSRTLKMDKTTAEKQLEQMKTRMAHLERRMNDIGGDDSSRLETPLPCSSTAVTPTTSSLGLINSFGAKDSSVDSEARTQLTYVSKLPMRQTSKSQYDTATRQLNNASSTAFSSEKENHFHDTATISRTKQSSHDMSSFVKRKVTKSNKCCLCNQDAVGMMKNCQCDKINCDKRAHMTCIAKRNSNKSISASAVLCD